eukprot:1592051-Karenia_brevis.AAC.1
MLTYDGLPRKRKRADANSGAERRPSSLVEALLYLWAWGVLSATVVQQLAKAAYDDGLQHPDVECLASLGTWGRNPNNCRRDLVDFKLNRIWLLDCVSPVKLPVSIKKTVIKAWVNMVLPHKIFAYMYRNNREMWVNKFLGGGIQKVRDFWKEMKGTPNYEQN